MKVVLYSAIVGGYDRLLQPKIFSHNYDYILFTNDIPEQKIGVWSIRHIPYSNKDNTRVARWVKTHPHLLFPDYEYSLWIDSNVVIDSSQFFDRIAESIDSKILLGGLDHIDRSCIYQEALQLLYLRYDKASSILAEVSYLLKQHYPANNGLIETNCVLRRHNSPIVRNMDEDWWYLINKYSKRDQLSFNYVAWKNRLPIKLLLGEKSNSRNHPWLHCEGHKKRDDKNDRIWKFLRDSYLSSVSSHYYKLLLEQSNSLLAYIHRLSIQIITFYYVDYLRRKIEIKLWIKQNMFPQ